MLLELFELFKFYLKLFVELFELPFQLPDVFNFYLLLLKNLNIQRFSTKLQLLESICNLL